MKKYTLYIILFCVALFSCKKDQNKKTEIEKYQKVTFSAGFSNYISAFGSTSNILKTNALPDTSLTNNIKVLLIMVYDSVGNRLQYLKQLNTDSTFGTASFNLIKGKYTVAFAAGQSNLNLKGSNLDSDFLTYESSGIYFPFTEMTFFKKIALTVNSNDIDQNVALNNIMSKLIVKIEDALPPQTNHVIVSTDLGAGNEFFVKTEKSAIRGGLDDGEFFYNSQMATPGTVNFTASQLFLYTNPLSIRIGAWSSTAVISERLVKNVTGAPNKITLLTGKLSGNISGNSTNAFRVGIDTAWNTPVTTKF